MFGRHQLVKALALGIEHRGKDATGVAWTRAQSGVLNLNKAPVSATKFFTDFVSVGYSARNALIHTRNATQGDPKVNANNHPIQTYGITGIHNGIVQNDDAIIQHYDLKRDADVDSVAAFAVIGAADDVRTALESIDGWAALAWVVDDDPTILHLARTSPSSPLYITRTKGGSLVFGSTLDTIYCDEMRTAFGDDNIDGYYDVPAGTYITFSPLTGEMTWRGFEPEARVKGPLVSWGGYGRYAGGRTATQIAYGGGWDDDEFDLAAWRAEQLALTNGGTATAQAADEGQAGPFEGEAEVAEADVVGASGHDPFRAPIEVGAIVELTRIPQGMHLLGVVTDMDGDECVIEFEPMILDVRYEAEDVAVIEYGVPPSKFEPKDEIDLLVEAEDADEFTIDEYEAFGYGEANAMVDIALGGGRVI